MLFIAATAPHRLSPPLEPIARLRARKKESCDATPSFVLDPTATVRLAINALRSHLLHQHLQPLPTAISAMSSSPLDQSATSATLSLHEPDVVVGRDCGGEMVVVVEREEGDKR